MNYPNYAIAPDVPIEWVYCPQGYLTKMDCIGSVLQQYDWADSVKEQFPPHRIQGRGASDVSSGPRLVGLLVHFVRFWNLGFLSRCGWRVER